MSTDAPAPLRIVALVKQIPRFETMTLDADGRLVRDGVELEMNAYCRRAVAKAVELAVERPGSAVTVLTLGPPPAADCLREAIAWATMHGLDAIDGVHLCDPAFAGSDTLATALALRAAIGRLEADGPVDLILCGRNSVDADTGQVGPQLAELLGAPFVSAARYLAIGAADGEGDEARPVHARCETDDGFVQMETSLPVVISCAERLCDPSKVDPPQRAEVDPARITTCTAAMLGPGPWGAAASPTNVGEVHTHAVARSAQRWPEAPLHEQVQRAVSLLRERGAFASDTAPAPPALRPFVTSDTAAVGARRVIAVIVEPDRAQLTQELLAAATSVEPTYTVTALVPIAAAGVIVDAAALTSWGADEIHAFDDAALEHVAAGAIATWLESYAASPGRVVAVLAPGTTWGREVASRVAARCRLGLTGDAIALTAGDAIALTAGDAPDGETPQIVAWKPAFGGALVAAIRSATTPHLVTVRPGVLARTQPRPVHGEAKVHHHRTAAPAGIDVRILVRTRDDDVEVLADASIVIAVGRGVPPSAYHALGPLQARLDAQFGATRKVTDEGWMPRSRQLGITGRSIAPHLLVSIGAGGKFNHTVGFRNAAHVLAINSDPSALIFAAADAGIVGPWEDVLPLVVRELDAQALGFGAGGRQNTASNPTQLPTPSSSVIQNAAAE